MASNGVAIGYGQRDSGVRYMPGSPSVGLAAGQASIGAALQEASKAFLHSSAAVAELELNAQRDQLDKLGTDNSIAGGAGLFDDGVWGNSLRAGKRVYQPDGPEELRAGV